MSDVDRSKRSLLKFGGYAAMLSYYVGAGGISVFTKPDFSGVLKKFTADEGKTILELETLPAFGLWGFASYAKPGGWGRQYASDIENYRNVAGLWIE